MMQSKQETAGEAAVDIRPMQPEDIPYATLIEHESFGESAWSAKALEAELQRPDAVLLCARVGGEIAGYCGMRTVLDEGYVNDIAVLPAFRRQGVGLALVEALVRYAKGRGLRFLTLEARASNETAIRLYERAGFRDVGVRRGFYDFPKEDARLMTIFLDEGQEGSGWIS